MILIIAAVVFWIGLVLSGVAYNVRRRNQLRCANMSCSQISRDRKGVTIPSVAEGITLDVKLCPECWALYRRWAVGR